VGFGWYLLTAEFGQTLTPCGSDFANREPDEWCGTVGWMPLYPLVFLAVSTITGLSLVVSAWLVSTLAGVLSLWLAALVIDRLSPRQPARTASVVMVLAVFPGMVWAHAIFPMSMVMALIWGAALALLSDRPLAGAALFGLAAVTHSTAMLMLPVVAVWLWWTRWRTRSYPWIETVVLVVPAAMLAVAQHINVGYWNANLLVQSTYDHRLSVFPVVLVARLRGLLITPGQVPWPWVSVQELLLAVMLTVAVIVSVFAWWRSRSAISDVEVLLLIVAVAAWLSSVSFTGDLAYWRVAIFVSPAMVALRRLPAPVTLAVAVIAAIVAVQVAQQFVDGLLY